MKGERDHDRGGKHHPVIVVQVQGSVDQLDICQGQGEDRSGHPVVVTEGDGQRRDPDDREVEVHPRRRPRGHPLESRVVVVEPRVHEKGVDPAVEEEPQHQHHTHHPEPDPEHRAGSSTDRSGGRGGERDHPVSPSVSEKPRVMSSSDTTSASNRVRSSARCS